MPIRAPLSPRIVSTFSTKTATIIVMATIASVNERKAENVFDKKTEKFESIRSIDIFRGIIPSEKIKS